MEVEMKIYKSVPSQTFRLVFTWSNILRGPLQLETQTVGVSSQRPNNLFKDCLKGAHFQHFHHFLQNRQVNNRRSGVKLWAKN